MTAGELSGKPDEMPRTTCHGLSYVWRGQLKGQEASSSSKKLNVGFICRY